MRRDERGFDFPLLDLHVHLEYGLTLPTAVELARRRHVTFGIVEHAGRGCALGTDGELDAYIESLAGQPVFRGIQAEGRDWTSCFSPETLQRLDYVLTDALTFPDPRRGNLELWRNDVRIDDAQEFITRYVQYHVLILSREPVDILANPTFLPACLADRYDALWSEERMDAVIGAAVAHGVALEINSRYRVPRPSFLERARRAGARFAFGSNHHGTEVGEIDYCVQMARRLGLAAQDVFVPGEPCGGWVD